VVTARPRVYFLQEFLTFGYGYASVELLSVTQQDERLGAPRQSPSLSSVEG
jgi:hypothetical protein